MRRALLFVSIGALVSCGPASDTEAPDAVVAESSEALLAPSVCKAGFADCDLNPANGCETNIKSGINCGACGVRCSENFATSQCVSPAPGAWACAVIRCAVGHADCDGDALNGCEADLLTSVSDCGACGNACTVPNGVAACTRGSCGFASCNPGYTLYGGSCVALVQSCAVPNGTGEQAFDAATGTYGACVATACDAGYVLSGGQCTSLYGDWATDVPCQDAGIEPACQPGDPGYHYRGAFNGYQCWWHTKNQAWNTTTATNIYALATRFGLDPTTGISTWCLTFADTPNPPNLDCGARECNGSGPFYNDPADVGAWGYCGELGPGLGGWVCLR